MTTVFSHGIAPGIHRRNHRFAALRSSHISSCDDAGHLARDHPLASSTHRCPRRSSTSSLLSSARLVVGSQYQGLILSCPNPSEPSLLARNLSSADGCSRPDRCTWGSASVQRCRVPRDPRPMSSYGRTPSKTLPTPSALSLTTSILPPNLSPSPSAPMGMIPLISRMYALIRAWEVSWFAPEGVKVSRSSIAGC